MKYVWNNARQSSRKPIIIGLLVILLAIAGSIYLTKLDMESHGKKSVKPRSGQALKVVKPVPIPPIHPTLSSSSNTQLSMLGDYERKLNRGFEQMMFFVAVPLTEKEVDERAKYTADVLNEYAAQDIDPLVIFEPVDLDIRKINGEIFAAYFKALKKYGVNDRSIGTWALFPEPNIPEWSSPEDRGNTDPELFKANFTEIAELLKSEFTKAKTLLLLNSASYQSYDTDYVREGNRDPEELLKYVKGLKGGVANSICLQGFPWLPDDLDAKNFVDADLAIAMARTLKLNNIRLNTGTFGRMYDRKLSPEQRKEILDEILNQAKIIRSTGYNVTLDMFIENKYDNEENADWSYSDEASWRIFQDFVAKTPKNGLKITIFDLAK